MAYRPVNGLQMYYEIDEPSREHAERPTLVLLHGALSTIETDFGALRARLAGRRIVAIEQQGHGHTADIDRPLTYDQMTDDTAGLLTQLGIRDADLLGYSMGGGIALQLAKRYPNLVRKVVFAGGASYEPSGLYPELMEGEQGMKPEDLTGSPFQRDYAKVAPHPENWPVLVEKTKQLDLTWHGLPPEYLRSITAPTLLIIGDADIVRPEHTVEMFRLLGGGVAGDLHGLPRAQLAVLPGTTHLTLVQRVEWLLSMVTAFLEAPVPATQGQPC